MQNSNRRGTLVLYFILAAIVGTLIATSAVTPPVGAVLLTLFFLFVLVTSGQMSRPTAPLPDLVRRTVKQPRVTEAAKVASARAASNSLLSPEYDLQDIGLVIDEQRRDGVVLRHARFLSKDEEAVRPYIVVHYHDRVHVRPVVVRFEMDDTSGQKQFIYEMEYFLQPGENLILPDYRLPLKKNGRAMDFGNWELRVEINDRVIGVHRFNMLPPLEERMKQARNDGEIPSRLIMEEESDEDLPLSLEELLSRHSH